MMIVEFMVNDSHPRRPLRYSCLLMTLCLSLLFSICMVGPNYQPPENSESVEIDLPEYFEFDYDPAKLSQWWNIFNDPSVDADGTVERGKESKNVNPLAKGSQ
ncbi:MAG: hypothetical protein K8S13_17915 [Desulfobacula sp.]|uniref:hypothetical protein n=1 Tax=Desulfobacula sp. TaxID=2593537 RepID=UPI0025C5E22D|nr:hypothetical protein [Desulfobacula sp.]MCD4721715.1 hypothetical protein [Desulfobacula sp.]